MMVNLKQILKYVGLRSLPASSQVFVSVSLVNTMPQARLSRRSTKVIVRVSIWTCLILISLFLLVYTILLACVDNQFHQSQFDLPYRKVKLLGRMNSQHRYSFVKAYVDDKLSEKAPTHRSVIWNSSLHYYPEVPLPQCMSQTFVTILVTSSPENSNRRMAIRNTWCNPEIFLMPKHTWACAFLIGASNSNNINAQIKEESALYNDILLGSYADSYRNLTLKVIHGFHWSTSYCSSTFVVKTDDDCFVNVRLLNEFLFEYNLKKYDLYAGNVILEKVKLKVIRGAQKKWAVRYEDYLEDYYPPYASGIGYVISSDAVKRLVAESAYITPIPNEDAYVGVVMSHLGITPTSSNRFVISSNGLSICNFLYVFIVHNVEAEMQADLFRKAIESQTKCNYMPITTWD